MFDFQNLAVYKKVKLFHLKFDYQYFIKLVYHLKNYEKTIF
jgi:hypothetical protein